MTKALTKTNLITSKSKDNNYNLLIQKRDNLKSQIDELNASLDGKENPYIANKINEFELEKSKVNKEVDARTKELETLKTKLTLITTNISKFSGGKKQVLLDAIKEKMKGKRFFFFKEPKELLFDCETGYLWENLDYVGLPKGSVNSVKNNILPNRKTGNIKNWELPSVQELARMIYSKKHPFHGSEKWRIGIDNSYFDYFLYNNGKIDFDDFTSINSNSDTNTDKNIHCYYLLCNSTFATKDIDPTNKVFTENEKAEKILNIFISNNWVPKFDDESLTDLYIKLFRERPALIKEYAEVEQQIAISLEKSKKFTKLFDFEKELINYDLKLVNRSLLSYNKNMKLWLDNLLDGIKDFKNNEKDILEKAFNFNEKLSSIKSENEIISKRNNFLKEKLNFEITTTEFNFIDMKNQILDLEDKISKTINLEKLAKFEEIKYPSFLFMVEHTANILNEKLSSINWFKENLEIIENLLLINEQWSEELKQFESMRKQDFIKKCKSEMISEEIYSLWFKNWSKERITLEEKFLPLIKAALDNIISFELLSKIEVAFKNHREALKSFYLNKRIDLYNKNIEKDNDGLIDKIIYEKELAEITENFHKSIEEFLFISSSTESRLFITELVSSWFENRVLEVIALVEQGGIPEEMMKIVLEKFRVLKRSEFNKYIKSKENYANYREKQYTEFQSLMRKMKVSLSK